MRIQLLGMGFLLLFGEVRFDQLALDRVFGMLDVEVANQLLGDCRGTLNGLATGEQILQGGPRDAGRVDAAVVIEVLVLYRDRRLLEELGKSFARRPVV